jgi:hypothetical protein
MAGQLDALKKRQREAATEFTKAFMDDVLGAAQRIAPLEEGTLSASADQEVIETANGVKVRGFFSTVYAARQHEDLTLRHREGRRAKYLEEPFKAAVPRYAPGLARVLERVR